MTWTRPPLDVQGPNRGIGGLARSADRRGPDGETIAGVPLHTVSDAVVATVRLGYRIADREIDRGRRWTEQMRGAAARAGADDPMQWLAAMEKLLGKAMPATDLWTPGQLGAWPEPMRRLLRAEARLMARWLGLALVDADTAEGQGPHVPKGTADAPAAPRPTAAPAPTPTVDLVLACADPADRRAVQLCHATWTALPAEPLALWFHGRGGVKGEPMRAELQPAAGRARLLLHTRRDQPEGRWRAAICAADGTQLGTAEVEL